MMKRIALSIMLLAVAVSMPAKIWIGGSLSINTSNTSLGSYNLDANNSIEVSPEIGYVLSGKWALGLRIGYAHYDNAETTMIDQTVAGQSNQFSVSPFVRYTFHRAGSFSFYADGSVDYLSTSKSGYDSNMNTLGAAVCPGMNYAINDRLGLTAHLGSLGYQHSWMKDRGIKLKNDAFNFNIFGSFAFGVYVNL